MYLGLSLSRASLHFSCSQASSFFTCVILSWVCCCNSFFIAASNSNSLNQDHLLKYPSHNVNTNNYQNKTNDHFAEVSQQTMTLLAKALLNLKQFQQQAMSVKYRTFLSSLRCGGRSRFLSSNLLNCDRSPFIVFLTPAFFLSANCIILSYSDFCFASSML